MSEPADRRCSNCGHSMEYIGTEQLQLGRAGFFFGHMSNLLAGALNVEIWCCPSCRKLDFYQAP